MKRFFLVYSYLKILELGHLIAREAKFEELIDPKKNARLLGGLISKLESRHPGAKLQGVIRKVIFIRSCLSFTELHDLYL